MKYPIDFKDSFEDTLRFWIERYIRYKLGSLSNRQVKDPEKIASVMKKLTLGTSNIKELSQLAKDARNAGLIGVNTYYKPLEKLYFFLKKYAPASMKEIDEELIIDFLTYSTSGLSNATKKNYRIAMINFFKFVEKQNEERYIFDIELKNWAGLRGRAGTKLPEFMREEEVSRFLKAIDEYPFREDAASRNRALIKIIVYTGIRVSEAINLKMRDIIEENGMYLLKIVGKGNKSRVVMLKSNHIKEDLHKWLKRRKCKNDLLFCNKKGTPLTQAYISKTVEKILLSAGIRKEKNGAHMLRHTFATLLYNKSKDLVLVQEALGHASLDTARIYTHFDREKMSKAANLMDDLG